MNLVFPEHSSGIVISPLSCSEIVEQIQDLVEFFFPASVDDYVGMGADEYRNLVGQAQRELNRRQIARRLANDRREVVCTVLNTETPLIQSNIYLRATRPSISGIQENIGWHRESFYGPDMENSLNFWVPIANVTSENAVRYIPDSHLIPDSDIETIQEHDNSVARFSPGHKIGLLYAPKKIVSGVDLTDQAPLVVLPGEAAVFAGALIHGAAVNRSHQIRFSVDFRLIAAESLSTSKQHFASGKSYFEQL